MFKKKPKFLTQKHSKESFDDIMEHQNNTVRAQSVSKLPEEDKISEESKSNDVCDFADLIK